MGCDGTCSHLHQWHVLKMLALSSSKLWLCMWSLSVQRPQGKNKFNPQCMYALPGEQNLHTDADLVSGITFLLFATHARTEVRDIAFVAHKLCIGYCAEFAFGSFSQSRHILDFSCCRHMPQLRCAALPSLQTSGALWGCREGSVVSIHIRSKASGSK